MEVEGRVDAAVAPVVARSWESGTDVDFEYSPALFVVGNKKACSLLDVCLEREVDVFYTPFDPSENPDILDWPYTPVETDLGDTAPAPDNRIGEVSFPVLPDG